MASKRREYYSRRYECGRKVRHVKKSSAKAHASMHKGFSAYKCRWCGFWHAGHTPKKRRKRHNKGMVYEQS
jgi:rubrerythrin